MSEQACVRILNPSSISSGKDFGIPEHKKHDGLRRCRERFDPLGTPGGLAPQTTLLTCLYQLYEMTTPHEIVKLKLCELKPEECCQDLVGSGTHCLAPISINDRDIAQNLALRPVEESAPSLSRAIPSPSFRPSFGNPWPIPRWYD